jgi:hypothetical protein
VPKTTRNRVVPEQKGSEAARLGGEERRLTATTAQGHGSQSPRSGEVSGRGRLLEFQGAVLVVIRALPPRLLG